MCVIIVQPPTSYLTKADAEAAWKTNPDGGGFAFIDQESGEIDTWKTMSFNSFWSSFERARSQNRQSPFIVHMRIATHGSVCIENVHPFWVDEHTVMAHNGIIKGVPDDTTGLDRSDTRMFIDLVLPDLQRGWLDNKLVREMVEEWVGWSKLAFLTTDPMLSQNFYILNEEAGHWENRMWYSNLYHWMGRPAKKTAFTPVGYVNSALAKYDSKYKKGADWGMDDSWENDNWNAEQAQWSWINEKGETIKGQLTAVPDYDEKELMELVITRDSNGYEWPIELSKLTGNILCTGCRQVIDESQGDCECYSWACMNCVKFLNNCYCTADKVLITPDFQLDEETVNYLLRSQQ